MVFLDLLLRVRGTVEPIEDFGFMRSDAFFYILVNLRPFFYLELKFIDFALGCVIELC